MSFEEQAYCQRLFANPNNHTQQNYLKAVKKYGWALKYVKNQTNEICLEAVKQNGTALKYVKNQTPQICYYALKQHPDAKHYIKIDMNLVTNYIETDNIINEISNEYTNNIIEIIELDENGLLEICI